MVGVGIGMGIFSVTFSYGIVGTGLYAILLFPHTTCYLFAILHINSNDWNGQKQTESIRKRDATNNNKGSNLGVLGVVIIGMLSECYVNPVVVKIFLKIFFDCFTIYCMWLLDLGIHIAKIL